MRLLVQLFSILIILCLQSCSFEDKEKTELILGTWHGSEWYIEGELHTYDMRRINFEFSPGNIYKAQLGDSQERGTFRIYGNKLYTQDGAAAQIMTNVEKLTSDSLVINMNRGGQREQLILLKASE